MNTPQEPIGYVDPSFLPISADGSMAFIDSVSGHDGVALYIHPLDVFAKAAVSKDDPFNTIMLLIADFAKLELNDVLNAAVSVKQRRQIAA